MATSIAASPQAADITPAMDRRTALAASLRRLADLFDDVPDLPLVVSPEISWNLGGDDDEARAIVAKLTAALADEGIAYQATDTADHGISVIIPLVGRYSARVTHVYDRQMSIYYARCSYEKVIQVELPEADQDGRVAS